MRIPGEFGTGRTFTLREQNQCLFDNTVGGEHMAKNARGKYGNGSTASLTRSAWGGSRSSELMIGRK